MSSDKYWEMLDTDYPEHVKDLVGLINWSQNFSSPTPFSLYLDLIGYSEEVMGENICEPKLPLVDFTGMDYLACALIEFSVRPLDVREWLDLLMNEEVSE